MTKRRLHAETKLLMHICGLGEDGERTVSGTETNKTNGIANEVRRPAVKEKRDKKKTINRSGS